MCPDRQIISLYHDGELPSPWKEKMETHLSECPQCRSILEGYGKLGETLSLKAEDSMQGAMERVWAKLGEQPVRQDIRRRKPIRYRTITLPLPVAAATAAAVLIIVAFFALMGLRSTPASLSQDPMVASAMGLDDYGIVPMDDMGEVLQYLSSQDNGDFMVIRLPESRRFSRPGEPALINAADYSRRDLSGTRRSIHP